MLENIIYNKTDSLLKRSSLLCGYLLTIISFSVIAFKQTSSAYVNIYDHFAKQAQVNILAVELDFKYQILEDRLSFSIADQKESAFRTRAMDMRAKYGDREHMTPEQREIYDYWIMEADKYKSKMNKLEEKSAMGDN